MRKHILIWAVMSLCLLTVLAACAGNTTSSPEPETWLCACGVGSSGKFCPECGEAKPADTAAETDTEAVTSEVTEHDTQETEAVTESGTEAETEAVTAAVTAAPRYDYFSANVKDDVTLDQSLYTGIELRLPAHLQVTQTDILDYIDYLRFQKRTADNGTTEMKDQPMKWGDDAYIYY